VDFRVRGVLRRDDMILFFSACNDLLREPTRTAIMMMPTCGLRSNEMAGLRLDSLQKVSILLKDGTHKTCLSLRVIGKGNKERFVPLLDEGKEIVSQYLLGWRRKSGSEWLFPSTHGQVKHITPHALWIAVAKVRESTGLVMSPHTLRRTYATTLWRRGVADTTVARVLGHAKLDTLYKHYLNMDATDLSAAVQEKGGRLLDV